MIVTIFSDVHGNLPALEKFVKFTEDKTDAYICLGDIVNYGPWNDECLELVYSLPGIVLLQGNHERLFLGIDEIENEIPLVQEFFHHSIKYFSRRDLISSLPAVYKIDKFVYTHTIDNRNIYENTAIEVTDNFIIGHTHHQYKIKQSGRIITNCGSIGQNRECIDVLNYALYDTSSGGITLCKETYPINRFIDELIVRGYSQRCIDYYLSKRRRITS